MKCFYYLSPSLDSSKKISDDLHEAGLHDWYMHVVSKDEAGLKKRHIHSSNYLETLDLPGGTLVGGSIGFVVSLIVVGLAVQVEPFGFPLSPTVYLIMIGFLTLFGIWEGGLYGIDKQNRKIKPFRKEIEAGKYLFLVYIAKEKETTITNMMEEKNPHAKQIGRAHV